MNAHGIVAEGAESAPQVSEILRRKITVDPFHHAAPSAGLHQANDRD
jgi:hypothetical protein